MPKTENEVLQEVLTAITAAKPEDGLDEFEAGVERGYDECWELVQRMLTEEPEVKPIMKENSRKERPASGDEGDGSGSSVGKESAL